MLDQFATARTLTNLTVNYDTASSHLFEGGGYSENIHGKVMDTK